MYRLTKLIVPHCLLTMTISSHPLHVLISSVAINGLFIPAEQKELVRRSSLGPLSSPRSTSLLYYCSKTKRPRKNLKHIQSCPKITASNKYAQTISTLSSIYSPTTKILNSSRLPDTPCTLTTPAAASNLKNLPGKANDSMATIPSYFSGSPAFLRILYFS